jgi:hypothetical protein
MQSLKILSELIPARLVALGWCELLAGHEYRACLNTFSRTPGATSQFKENGQFQPNSEMGMSKKFSHSPSLRRCQK